MFLLDSIWVLTNSKCSIWSSVTVPKFMELRPACKTCSTFWGAVPNLWDAVPQIVGMFQKKWNCSTLRRSSWILPIFLVDLVSHFGFLFLKYKCYIYVFYLNNWTNYDLTLVFLKFIILMVIYTLFWNAFLCIVLRIKYFKALEPSAVSTPQSVALVSASVY